MQLPNSPTLSQFPAIELAMHHERLKRYLPAAGKDIALAFRYYLWNCMLCESFHFPLHFAEIVARNALHSALLSRCGTQWYSNPLFKTLLAAEYNSELEMAYAKEAKQHGVLTTPHHVVSARTFGFWEHLTTKRFERYLWAKGVQNVFPNAQRKMPLQDLHDLIESVRRWRNRIAHHQAIFDKGPMRKHADALRLIGLVCADTHAWVAAGSRVPEAISLRP